MSQLKDFDIDSLTLVLNNELDFVVAALQQNEAQSNLRVEKVKLKLGQRQESAAPFINSLDGNRYPSEEPWEVELQYSLDHSKSVSSVYGSESEIQEKLLLENFKDVSIQKIKGIDDFWLKKWSKIGVKTIGDLAKIAPEKVVEFSKNQNNIAPIEHYSKCSLLQEIGIQNSLQGFENITLETLLLTSTESLKALFSHKISIPQLSNYQRQSRLLLIVFDMEFIKSLPVTMLG